MLSTYVFNIETGVRHKHNTLVPFLFVVVSDFVGNERTDFLCKVNI